MTVAAVERVAGFGALLGPATALLMPLALGGCAPPVPSSPSEAAVGPAALVDRLPAVAAGFRRGESRPTAGAAAGEGREVAYSTEGGTSTAAATVELLADPTPPAAALDAALAEAERAAGPAREMREAGRVVIAPAAGGAAPPLLCADTAGRYGRERVAGLVCTGRAGGALLRIRVAMPARQPPPADPRAFAEAIAASLSGPPPPG